MVRDMEMTGEVEDSSLIEDGPGREPASKMRRLLAVGGVLLVAAGACAMLFGGSHTASEVEAVETETPETALVGANAESEFPWGFFLVEECGVQYEVKELLHSNLGHQGPDAGAEGIQFRCAENVNRRYIRDIIVHVNAVTPYASSSAHMNGKKEDFGAIHVDAGSEVKVLVHFTDLDGKHLTLEHFHMTFYDLDEAPGHLSQEYIIATGHPHTDRDAHTDVKEEHVHGDVEFEATEIGSGADNPESASDLTNLQRDRSVVLSYSHIKQFHVTIGAKAGHSPRAFEFSLTSALSCHKVKVAKTSTTQTTTTMTTTTTTTEGVPPDYTIPIIVASVIAGTAALAALIYWLLAFLKQRELAEIAYFEGTS